jgi:hypothetical protein
MTKKTSRNHFDVVSMNYVTETKSLDSLSPYAQQTRNHNHLSVFSSTCMRHYMHLHAREVEIAEGMHFYLIKAMKSV